MDDDLLVWSKQNEKFLSVALKWLRLRLKEYTEQGPNPQPVTTPVAPPSGSSFFNWLQPEKMKPAEQVVETEVMRAAREMTQAQNVEPPPALLILSERFGLSTFEQSVMLLCTGMELDTRIAGLCAEAQADPNRPYPTFALALALFDDPAWDVLSPERPLRRWQLIEINQPGAQPLTTSPLRADERIVNHIKGLNYLDDRLTSFLLSIEIGANIGNLPPSHQADVETIINHLEKGRNTGDIPLIQLLGSDSASKQLIAQRAAATFGLNLYRLPAESLPPQMAELETLIRLWERESRLLPIALYLDALETAGISLSAEQNRAINRFLELNTGLLFLDTREMWPGVSRHNVSLDITRPTMFEQQAVWEVILESKNTAWPARLAGQFNLNLVSIRQVARTMSAAKARDEAERPRLLWDACLDNTRPRLDMLAQRIDTKATWDDIVLLEEEMGLLRQIADQVGQRTQVYERWGFRHRMNRGLGISVLFAGESGTGKTMAAEVIANHLRLNLYRIDLSAVVSKYIGETEKNLRRLFDAAEDGGAILLFDEADALFGKRSEVKDSHDRYANIEINYLLQRMENYRGLAILATNMKKALDHAFLRRLRFTVSFPFPGPKERKLIWQKVFPPETPVGDVDYERLARLNLTGGSIHNVALNAAFLAAEAGTEVTMELLLRAARTEFRKLERPINEADFR
jgi:hypothetical protein